MVGRAFIGRLVGCSVSEYVVFMCIFKFDVAFMHFSTATLCLSLNMSSSCSNTPKGLVTFSQMFTVIFILLFIFVQCTGLKCMCVIFVQS